MSIPTDVALYDSGGQLVAFVQFCNKRGTSRAWATEFRRNILAHGGFPQARFFLFITPDRIYLWKNAASAGPEVEPDFEIDAIPIFKPYLKRLRRKVISSEAFELLASGWLSELINFPRLSTERLAWQRALIESGFLKAVTGGKIEFGVAA